MVEQHPAYNVGGVIYPAFNLDYEYEIGYVKTGPQGNRGETGSIGPRGETGPLGPRGETGSIGPRGETGPMGPRGMTGEPGQDGAGLNGVMSVTFFKILTGRYTQWKDLPPYISFNPNVYNIQNFSATPVSSLGPYITIDGKGPHDWAPLRDFEFFHLGAIGGVISGSNPVPGSFPLDEHVQNTPGNTYITPVNNLALPKAGPSFGTSVPIGTRLGHNNFYGYRVPQKGVLIGYSLDFVQRPNDGIFHVFYWKPGVPDEENPNIGKVIFCKGGPIVCSGSGGAEELDYASGNTIFKTAYEIPIEQDGYIFAASDLSYFRTPDETVQQNVGTLADVWTTSGWSGQPFVAPGGRTHITIYVKFNNN